MRALHFRVSVGRTRNKSVNRSAGRKFDYIAREGKYGKGKGANEEVLLLESHNMPSWAAENPALYWKSTDKYERAQDSSKRPGETEKEYDARLRKSSARLFTQFIIALPRDLTTQKQAELVREFAEAITTKSGGKCPYTFVIHSGGGKNPHAHLMISERMNDGIERNPRTYFMRAATVLKKKHETMEEFEERKRTLDAGRGGARKTTDFRPVEFPQQSRAKFCEIANRHLEAAGLPLRLDPRSYKDQGLNRVPEIHEGYGKAERKQYNQRVRKVNAEMETRNETLEQLQQRFKREYVEAAAAKDKAHKVFDEIEAKLMAEAELLRPALESNAMLQRVAAEIENGEEPQLTHHDAAVLYDVLHPSPSGTKLYGQMRGKSVISGYGVKSLVSDAIKYGSAKEPVKAMADLVANVGDERIKFVPWKGKQKALADAIRKGAEKQLEWDTKQLQRRQESQKEQRQKREKVKEREGNSLG